MILHNVEQGTDAWKKLRLGKFTSSTFSDLFAKEATATYQNAINKVVFERITGELPEFYTNKYMERGTELEAEARKSYEETTFTKVHQIGFVELSEWVGASPDGFIGKDGGVQIKCPIYSTLISYHLSGKVPTDYLYQMQGELWVTGRQWIDFYCYHPKLRPVIKRIFRDERIINDIAKAIYHGIDKAIIRIGQIIGKETKWLVNV